MKKILIAFLAVFLMTFAGFASAVVDLNTATAAELKALKKGIGDAKAKAIIDYRDKNGPFKSVDELAKVKGFGAKTVDKLRPDLTVGGAAPAPAAAMAPKAAAPAPFAPPAPKPATLAPAAKPVAPPTAPVH